MKETRGLFEEEICSKSFESIDTMKHKMLHNHSFFFTIAQPAVPSVENRLREKSKFVGNCEASLNI